MSKTIETEEDIILLVNSFYEKVRADKDLGYIFDGVAKVNWETHLPKITEFWKGIAFGKSNFEGNPMQAHILLNNKTPLKPENFKRWLELFKNTLKEHFTGSKADELYERAERIASLIQLKVSQ